MFTLSYTTLGSSLLVFLIGDYNAVRFCKLCFTFLAIPLTLGLTASPQVRTKGGHNASLTAKYLTPWRRAWTAWPSCKRAAAATGDRSTELAAALSNVALFPCFINTYQNLNIPRLNLNPAVRSCLFPTLSFSQEFVMMMIRGIRLFISSREGR